MLADFGAELRRPATAIAIFIALISIVSGTITSVYFYHKSIKLGVIYYDVVQILAFDQTNLREKVIGVESPVAVVDGAGQKIDGNIYVANIRVWNGGNDEVRKEDIRSQLKVMISGNVRLIDITMYGQTNNNVDQFSLTKDTGIEWNHFDSQEGFILRIVYSSAEKQNISIIGRIVNSGYPSNFAEIKERYQQTPFYLFAAMVSMMSIITLIFIIVSIIRIIRSLSRGEATVKSIIVTPMKGFLKEIMLSIGIFVIAILFGYLFNFDKFLNFVGMLPVFPF